MSTVSRWNFFVFNFNRRFGEIPLKVKAEGEREKKNKQTNKQKNRTKKEGRKEMKK